MDLPIPSNSLDFLLEDGSSEVLSSVLRHSPDWHEQMHKWMQDWGFNEAISESLETGFDLRVNLSKFWVLWAFMDIKVPQSKDMKPFNVSPALGRFSFFWLFLWKRHSLAGGTRGHCTMLAFCCCNIPLGLKGFVKSLLSLSVCWEHVLAGSKTPSNTAVYKAKREGHFLSLSV